MKGKKQLLWINLPNHQASFSIWGEGESERYIYCQGKTLISIHWASVSIKPTTFSEHFSNLNVFTYNNTITILFFWPLSLSLPYCHIFTNTKRLRNWFLLYFCRLKRRKYSKTKTFYILQDLFVCRSRKVFPFFFTFFFFLLFSRVSWVQSLIRSILRLFSCFFVLLLNFRTAFLLFLSSCGKTFSMKLQTFWFVRNRRGKEINHNFRLFKCWHLGAKVQIEGKNEATWIKQPARESHRSEKCYEPFTESRANVYSWRR